FAARGSTVQALAELGYRVDSSVTPHTCWLTRPQIIDYRDAPNQPYRPSADNICCVGNLKIWEIPVSVTLMGGRPDPSFAKSALGLPLPIATRLYSALRPSPRYWLRPSYHDSETLCRTADWLIENAPASGATLVIFFHSNEYVQKMSPYAKTEEEVRELL